MAKHPSTFEWKPPRHPVFHVMQVALLLLLVTIVNVRGTSTEAIFDS